jgi:hypothetical protein
VLPFPLSTRMLSWLTEYDARRNLKTAQELGMETIRQNLGFFFPGEHLIHNMR